MLGGLFYLNSLDRSIFSRCDAELLFLSLPCFIETHAFNSNSVDPDQTPRSAASDLDLHCLPMSLLWNARHKWVTAHCMCAQGRQIRLHGCQSSKVSLLVAKDLQVDSKNPDQPVRMCRVI